MEYEADGGCDVGSGHQKKDDHFIKKCKCLQHAHAKTKHLLGSQTVLWNPSRDVNTPNHAFHENTIPLLVRWSSAFDIYVIAHTTTPQDKHQIETLLNNSNLFNFIDSRKVLYCSSEQGKLHLIKQIEPSVHIEGGWELEDGSDIVQRLEDTRVIWILPNQKKRELYQHFDMEITDHVLNTSVARI